ncbi:DnaB-like helicase N-terminal domain-containing protein [Actinosynnema sp. NPDC059335]|uniref:DnaB-like helicase N-terminal domain-containing protein n=1 Tax=Actinosynnema sp. NPDC059335 TaxID=3346804 RepID=UPI00366D7056
MVGYNYPIADLPTSESVPDVDEVTVAADTDRVELPQDLQAEQAVLGAVITSKDAVADVVELLRHDDFYGFGHNLVSDAVLELYGSGQPGGPTEVVGLLRHRNLLERAGGEEYVLSLPAKALKADAVVSHAERFALDTGASVVVTAQLSTNPGPRQPVPLRPSLADLRDSGTIAHVSDLVLLKKYIALRRQTVLR